MLIGLAGYAGSGKDTVGKILVDSYSFRRIAFADKVKELALKIDPEVAGEFYGLPLSEYLEDVGGWEAAKKNLSVRQLLQKLGQGVREVVGEDSWIDAALSSYSYYGQDTVITDVRYPNELEVIRDMGGVVWWVNRPGVGPLNTHSSENSVSQSDADIRVSNAGTQMFLKTEVEFALKDSLRK